MFAPLFPFPEAVQFLYQYNFDVTPACIFPQRMHVIQRSSVDYCAVSTASRLPEPASPHMEILKSGTQVAV